MEVLGSFEKFGDNCLGLADLGNRTRRLMVKNEHMDIKAFTILFIIIYLTCHDEISTS
jgi:hypothetical protein